jgi:hypothetical protein
MTAYLSRAGNASYSAAVSSMLEVFPGDGLLFDDSSPPQARRDGTVTSRIAKVSRRIGSSSDR